jgi:hypothetical protein
MVILFWDVPFFNSETKPVHKVCFIFARGSRESSQIEHLFYAGKQHETLETNEKRGQTWGGSKG